MKKQNFLRLVRSNTYKILAIPSAIAVLLCINTQAIQGTSIEFLYWAAFFLVMFNFFLTPWDLVEWNLSSHARLKELAAQRGLRLISPHWMGFKSPYEFQDKDGRRTILGISELVDRPSMGHPGKK